MLLEQIMTCHFIPGGHLLSPLTGNVLELRQKPKAMIKHEAPEFNDGKAELHRGRGQTASATLDIKDKNAKKSSMMKRKIGFPNSRVQNAELTNHLL